MSAPKNKKGGPRDGWCTPQWLVDGLEEALAHAGYTIGLDPCSNERSVVPARVGLTLERGEDGLSNERPEVRDGEVVFVNPPFSSPMPWVLRYRDAVFLVPIATGTRWWRELVHTAALSMYTFPERVNFVPPPGVKSSSNQTPIALVVVGQVSNRAMQWGGTTNLTQRWTRWTPR